MDPVSADTTVRTNGMGPKLGVSIITICSRLFAGSARLAVPRANGVKHVPCVQIRQLTGPLEPLQFPTKVSKRKDHK